jgi:carboxymethylenebutenolidase
MKLFCAVLIVLCGLPSFAATSKNVSYKSGDDTVQAVLYSPEGKGPFPGIVVIHEWWGLNDWVKEQGSKLSDEGYVTLAIDLYRGKVATTPELAHELMRGVPEDRALRDLHAAVEFLKSQPNVKADRLGSIGWCMGGGYSLDVALQEPTLAATVINYGHLATDPDSLKKINASILGLFGGQDQGIPVADVQKFAATLKQMGKNVDITVYPDAGHGFENPHNASYRATNAAEARERTLKFFAGTLKK